MSMHIPSRCQHEEANLHHLIARKMQLICILKAHQDVKEDNCILSHWDKTGGSAGSDDAACCHGQKLAPGS